MTADFNAAVRLVKGCGAPAGVIAMASVDEVGGIGRDGGIPWAYPEDHGLFKRVTLGHPCIMGRRTYESIVDSLGYSLPGRHSLVLSASKPMMKKTGPDAFVSRHHNLRTAILAAVGEDTRVFIAGGQSVYLEAIIQGHVDWLLLTHVPGMYGCDVRLPGWGWGDALHTAEALGYEFDSAARIDKAGRLLLSAWRRKE